MRRIWCWFRKTKSRRPLSHFSTRDDCRDPSRVPQRIRPHMSMQGRFIEELRAPDGPRETNDNVRLLPLEAKIDAAEPSPIDPRYDPPIRDVLRRGIDLH